MNKKRINICGVSLDRIKRKEALEQVNQFLHTDGQYTIFTPNPEMIVDAQRDEYFKEILQESDLNICDGIGLVFASFFRLQKISGVDFMLDILAEAEREKKRVYFLGSGDRAVLDNMINILHKKFPTVYIAGSHEGINISQIKENGRSILYYDEKENNDMIADIVMSEADILFVAFGHKKQEKWIYEHIKDIPRLKIAMGVGGSFDFLGEKIQRAPKFLRHIGCEWLYRLVQEPCRLKRIWNATIVFLFYFFKYLFR